MTALIQADHRPWTYDEEAELLKQIQKKTARDAIASKLERSQHAILHKLKHMAADYFFNEKRPYEEIMRFTGLSRDLIQDAISKRRWRLQTAPKAPVSAQTAAEAQPPENDRQKFGMLVQIWRSVASELKKGHAECVYRDAICVDLQENSIKYGKEESMPTLYKGRTVGQIRADIILYSWLPLVIELKATTKMLPKFTWQCIRYMKAKNLKYGAVVNFSENDNEDITYFFLVEHKGVYYMYYLDTGKMYELKDF